jgi:EmrB/QacA subfamily drug resistance transporter
VRLLGTVQWVATAYLLTLAAVIPLTGWASRRFGARRVWISAVAAFTGGSLLCSLAWSIESLIAFRIVQGFGGGMVLPVGQALLVRLAGRRRLGAVMSMYNLPLLIGPILGPVVGGLLIDGPGWHSIFLVNVPLGLLAMALGVTFLPAGGREGPERLNWGGFLLLSGGLTAVVFGATVAADGSASRAFALAIVGLGLAALVAFALGSGTPRTRALVDLTLFRRRAFASSAAVAFAFNFVQFGGAALLLRYLQVGSGESAATAGGVLAMQGAGSICALLLVGRATDRFGAGWVAPCGLSIAALGTVPFLLLGAGSSMLVLTLAIFVRGFGLSCTMTPAYAAAYEGLESSAITHATTVINVVSRFAGSIGIAALFLLLLQSQSSVASVSESGSQDGAVVGPQLDYSRDAAFSHTFLLALGVTLIAIIPAGMLSRRWSPGRPWGCRG